LTNQMRPERVFQDVHMTDVRSIDHLPGDIQATRMRTRDVLTRILTSTQIAGNLPGVQCGVGCTVAPTFSSHFSSVRVPRGKPNV
jgi:hypothetical protein